MYRKALKLTRFATNSKKSKGVFVMMYNHRFERGIYVYPSKDLDGISGGDITRFIISFDSNDGKARIRCDEKTTVDVLTCALGRALTDYAEMFEGARIQIKVSEPRTFGRHYRYVRGYGSMLLYEEFSNHSEMMDYPKRRFVSSPLAILTEKCNVLEWEPVSDVLEAALAAGLIQEVDGCFAPKDGALEGYWTDSQPPRETYGERGWGCYWKEVFGLQPQIVSECDEWWDDEWFDDEEWVSLPLRSLNGPLFLPQLIIDSEAD